MELLSTSFGNMTAPENTLDDVTATFPAMFDNMTITEGLEQQDLDKAKAKHLPGFIAVDAALSILGIIGNFLVLTVVSRKSFRETSFGVHLIFLAVFDCGVLITQTMLINYDPTGEFMCKAMPYLNTMFEMQSSWTLVIITTERFFAVYTPHRSKVVNTPCRAAFVQIVVSIILALISIGVIFSTLLYKDGTNSECISKTSTEDERLQFVSHLTYDLILYSFLPFFILSILNVLLVVSLRHSNKFRQNSTMGHNDNDDNRRLTVMLLCTSLFYILTTLPVAIHLTMTDFNTAYKTLVEIPKVAALEKSLFILQKCNHAFNFVVYCLTGSQFRKGLKLTWTCK